MNKTVEIIKANKSVQEFYEIENDNCPLCKNEINGVTNIVKLGNVGYHSECYFNNTSDSFKIK